MRIKSYFGLFTCILSFLAAEEAPIPSHFVSFIIPCFNCERTVEESIASIYQQHLNCPFEVICTDDASSDHTRLVLTVCEEQYPNLSVFFHEENKGGGAARNTCVSHSRGDLIFCLDSDNVLAPNTVQALIDLIDHTGCDIAVFRSIKFFSGNYERIRIWSYPMEETFLDVIPFITADLRCNNIPYNPAHSGNYLFTRKSYDRAGGYLENYGAVDTAAFGLAQLATGSKMALHPHYFYWHRQDGDSYWNREDSRNDRNFCKLLKEFSEVISDDTLDFIENQLDANASGLWLKWERGELKPASPLILENLAKAHIYKENKQYQEAADAFAAVLQYGCKSPKIEHYMQEMYSLSKEE